MNFLDIESIDKQKNTQKYIKKYVESLGYHSGRRINDYIYRTTKYCLNSKVVSISIENNLCDKIKHLVLRYNGKIKSWWFDVIECYKVAICFDDFMTKNHKETDWTTFFNVKFFNVNINKYVKEFWNQTTYEDIMNIPDQWFFDRAYFYMQVYNYSPYFNNFTKKEFEIFRLRDFEYTDIIKIDDNTIHSNLDEIFGEDKVWKMANNRFGVGY